jgi:transposase InsO family protein
MCFSVLKKKEVSCDKHRVARLMRENNIRSVHKLKYKMTTDFNHNYFYSDNILDRQFDVSKLNECWAPDITYVPVQEGLLYLAVVLGLFNWEVVGIANNAKFVHCRIKYGSRWQESVRRIITSFGSRKSISELRISRDIG